MKYIGTMRVRISCLFVLGIGLWLAACGPAEPEVHLVDADATAETKALFANLERIADEAVLFGHHDDLAYGVHWKGEPGRSDVRAVAGSYPAVYGWDVKRLFEDDEDASADQLRQWIESGYERGGVITISWHMANPVTGRSFYDTTRAVHAILPGGAQHEWYRERLDRFAAFANNLDVGFWDWLGLGHPVPIIFRPFHEMTGSWFWWGGDNTTPEEYRRLWRFTVEYLRDEKDVHNLLYAYSPDVFESREEYLRYYPGDAYVDVLGYDDYHSVGADSTRPLFTERLRMLVDMVEERDKVAALTETGVEAIPDSTWWTETLLPGLKSDSLTRRIAYLLVWRNAHEKTDRDNHYYAPYPGQASAENFVRFRNDSLILFEDDLPRLYEMP